MEIIKLDNPLFVANLAPQIEKLLNKTDQPYMNYHSIVAHLQRTVQLGGTRAEVFVAYEPDEESGDPGVLGFASWTVRDIPYVGTSYLEFIYSKRKGVAEALLLEFGEFCDRNNSPYMMCDIAANGKVIDHFKSIAQKYNFNMVKVPQVTFLARR